MEDEVMSSKFKNIDEIDVSLSPMINFFDNLQDSKFMEAMSLFSKDWGFGNEYHICSFASSWHPQEEGYFESGVQFVDATGNDEKSVIVDYSTFYKYLSVACEDYLSRHPQDRNKVEDGLKAIRERYNI